MQNLIKNAKKDDPSVGELAESWINGNRNTVIQALWSYPPHIAAAVVLELVHRGLREDANAVTNRLIDRFIEERDI